MRERTGQAPLYRDVVMTLSSGPTHYACAGASGPAVVLVHGGASDRNDWFPSLELLSRSYRAFAPDLPGYGESPRTDEPYTLTHFTRFLHEFMDALGLNRAHLVGHSLGGRVCLEVARQAPERVGTLVMEAPIGFGKLSLQGRMISTGFWYAAKALRRRLPYPRLNVELDEAHPNGLPEVKAPTLVLWGTADRYFPASYAQRVQALIPHARVGLVVGAGHAPHREQPEVFNRLLLDFLANGTASWTGGKPGESVVT